MSHITLTYPLQDLIDVALGSQVRQNDDDIVAVVNGALDNSNFLSGADAAGLGLTSDKIANLAITNAKLAVNAVTNTKILDGEVYGVKLANDLSGSEGQGANRNELFNKADGTGVDTNVIVGRKQHGGKIVTAYFSIPDAAVYVIDDSIDWRERVIVMVAYGFEQAAGAKKDIPDGVNDDDISGFVWSALGVRDPTFNAGIFFSEKGTADPVAGTQKLQLSFGAPATFLNFAARDTDGALIQKASALGAADMDVTMMIIAGPYLGTV